VDLFLFEDSPDFGCEFVEQYLNRVIVYIGGIVRQHFASKDGNGLAIVSGFGFRARIDNFTASKHAREKRFSTGIALSHPAVGRTDRLFEIIDPARWAIAGAQAPSNLELAPRTFRGGNDREALHWRTRPTSDSRVDHGGNYALFLRFWACDLTTASLLTSSCAGGYKTETAEVVFRVPAERGPLAARQRSGNQVVREMALSV